MNHPQNLARKVRDELAENPFPQTIGRLNAKQAEQLEIQKGYAQSLETAVSSPAVLGARIAESKQRIAHELSTQQALVASRAQRREADLEQSRRSHADCARAAAILGDERERSTQKWRRAEQLAADLADRRGHGGLDAAQRDTQASVASSRRSPSRADSRAATDAAMTADERWARMRRVVDAQTEPAVPLHEMFPSIAQFSHMETPAELKN